MSDYGQFESFFGPAPNMGKTGRIESKTLTFRTTIPRSGGEPLFVCLLLGYYHGIEILPQIARNGKQFPVENACENRSPPVREKYFSFAGNRKFVVFCGDSSNGMRVAQKNRNICQKIG